MIDEHHHMVADDDGMPPADHDYVNVFGFNRRYLLICEGACNPDLARVDALVEPLAMKRAMHATGFDGPMQVGDESLWSQQRRLTYTMHEKLGTIGPARCLTCGHDRRYGGSL